MKEAFDAEPCALLDNKKLLTTKRGSTLYVHIPEGLTSCGLTLKPLDVMPKSVTLLNDGRRLEFGVVTRPEDKDWSTQLLRRQTLHIFDIPADEFEGETMVIKIELDDSPIKV